MMGAGLGRGGDGGGRVKGRRWDRSAVMGAGCYVTAASRSRSSSPSRTRSRSPVPGGDCIVRHTINACGVCSA